VVPRAPSARVLLDPLTITVHIERLAERDPPLSGNARAGYGRASHCTAETSGVAYFSSEEVGPVETAGPRTGADRVIADEYAP
jgi:hypothetical protein